MYSQINFMNDRMLGEANEISFTTLKHSLCSFVARFTASFVSLVSNAIRRFGTHNPGAKVTHKSKSFEMQSQPHGAPKFGKVTSHFCVENLFNAFHQMDTK